MSKMDDFRIRFEQDAAHDIDGGVMPVEQGRSGYNAYGATQQRRCDFSGWKGDCHGHKFLTANKGCFIGA